MPERRNRARELPGARRARDRGVGLDLLREQVREDLPVRAQRPLEVEAGRPRQVGDRARPLDLPVRRHDGELGEVEPAGLLDVVPPHAECGLVGEDLARAVGEHAGQIVQPHPGPEVPAVLALPRLDQGVQRSGHLRLVGLLRRQQLGDVARQARLDPGRTRSLEVAGPHLRGREREVRPRRRRSPGIHGQGELVLADVVPALARPAGRVGGEELAAGADDRGQGDRDRVEHDLLLAPSRLERGLGVLLLAGDGELAPRLGVDGGHARHLVEQGRHLELLGIALAREREVLERGGHTRRCGAALGARGRDEPVAAELLDDGQPLEDQALELGVAAGLEPVDDPLVAGLELALAGELAPCRGRPSRGADPLPP